MAKLIHNSPLGALEIPGVLGHPEPGEPFDVDDDLIEDLLAQSDLYAPAPKPRSKAAAKPAANPADTEGVSA